MKRNMLLSVGLSLLFVSGLSAAERTFLPVRDRLQLESLNGTWDFSFRGRDERMKCNVPGNWETQGLSRPGYSATVPDNVGVYRRSFAFNPAWRGRHVILRFDGVMYSFCVSVNGREVARDVRSAYNLHQFDITALLKEGLNEIEVAVSSRGELTGFDKCDDWSICGIQRDVDLFTLADDYLSSVQFATTVDAGGDAEVSLKVGTGSFVDGERPVRVNAFLSDRTRRQVLAFSGAPENGVCVFAGRLEQPDLWTAETPSLYWLTVELLSDAGEVIQRHEETVGVREVRVEGRKLLVNNRPVKLKGVCLNEIDPKVGRAFREDDFRRRLAEMKRCHVNFIRTAHYPFAPAFYDLCDEMGFYVCDEVPYSSCSRSQLGKDASLPAMVDRAVRTVTRDRNRPSVILWSVGNENPYWENTVGRILDLVKELDPTRPRTLPHAREIGLGKLGEDSVRAFIASVKGRLDIASIHYASPATVDRLLDVIGEMPLIQTEYAHAMGEGFNSFEASVSQIVADDRLIGGSVWCWHDQGLLLDESDMAYYAAHTNRWPTDEAKPRLWTSPPKFQGVWTDPRHFVDCRGSYGADGIVYATGYPKESWQLVRKLYSPVVVTETNGLLTVENRHDFVSLRGWRLKWTGGEAWLSAAPGRSETFACDRNRPFVDVAVYDPRGERVWETSFRGAEPSPVPYASRKDPDVRAWLGRMLLKVGRKPGINYLCRLNGKVSKMEKADKVGGVKSEKFEWEPYVIRPKVVSFEAVAENRYAATLRYCRGEDESSAEYFEARLSVKVNRDGALKVRYALEASPAVNTVCSEIGLAFSAEGATRVDWDGDGPWTGTPGKSLHATPGLWSLSAESLFLPGNRRNVRWAMASDGKAGLALTNRSGDVSFSVWQGKVLLSANCHVAGYGGKFDWGVDSISARGLRRTGELTCAEVDVSRPLKPVVPDRPFSSHYGW